MRCQWERSLQYSWRRIRQIRRWSVMINLHNHTSSIHWWDTDTVLTREVFPNKRSKLYKWNRPKISKIPPKYHFAINWMSSNLCVCLLQTNERVAQQSLTTTSLLDVVLFSVLFLVFQETLEHEHNWTAKSNQRWPMKVPASATLSITCLFTDFNAFLLFFSLPFVCDYFLIHDDGRDDDLLRWWQSLP